MAITLGQWISIAIGLVNLLAVAIAILNVLARNKREWQRFEDRQWAAEKAIVILQQETKALIGIDVKMSDLGREMERLRTRLDRFLDSQTEMQKRALP